ncbi:response regulator transcription factor [Glaciihabitans arcticus]|uniref:Response regulator transcription factor n=1 Tax=Glaciihabitans arcticus TaxID=2668039 RepID=A0A4Q9GYM9_9MICO|nr:response regulator transcription factor [Glaciihabitans arcticus]TBN57893.1 response regulator transcription factor [Glaciihabitans arcticus]
MSAIRVVLVDDQALFREGVGVIISAQSDMEVVGTAGDGAQALTVIEATRPDVVLMDIRMPVMDGVEATRQLFERNPDQAPRVIVLTTFNLDLAAATAMRFGASGFLLKDSTPDFLCAAVRAVHSGSSVIAPADLAELFAPRTAAPTPAPATYETLSARERTVFQSAARGLSNSEIAEEFFLSLHTVKSHISTILGKLGLRDRVQLVIFAHDHALLE